MTTINSVSNRQSSRSHKPPELIFLIKSLLLSATNRFPFVSTATPIGFLNLATVPIPSADPPVVVKPAMVVTLPEL